MIAKDFIGKYRESKSFEFEKFISFDNPTKIEKYGVWSDPKQPFRKEIVDELMSDFSKNDLLLIRKLMQSSIKATRQDSVSDGTLTDLAFMLFYFGELEDVKLIYESKFHSCWDSMCSGYRDMLTMNRGKNEVISYVRKNNIEEKGIYSNQQILQEVEFAFDEPDYDTKEKFMEFIYGYYGKAIKK